MLEVVVVELDMVLQQSARRNWWRWKEVLDQLELHQEQQIQVVEWWRWRCSPGSQVKLAVQE
jgi:hypothetical protein